MLVEDLTIGGADNGIRVMSDRSRGSYTFLGLDAEHKLVKLGLTLNNVFVEDQEHSAWLTKNADIIVGSNRGNLEPKGPLQVPKQ